MIRKFFDMQAEGVPSTPAEPINIAALMAKAGQKTDATTSYQAPPPPPAAVPVETPADIPTEPAPSTEPVQAAPAVTQPTFTTAIDEPVTEPAPTAATINTFNLEEEIKKTPKDAVLKALGVDAKKFGLLEKMDDKMSSFFEYWQTKGDVKPYLEALATDYDTMTPEQIMRLDLQKKYPEATPSQLSMLYKKKVEDYYNLDDALNEPEDVEMGKLLMQADAKEIRNRLNQEKQNFLLSAAPELQPQVDPVKQLEEQQASQLQIYNQQLDSDPYAKGFIESKSIQLGSGEEAFNVSISDPQNVLKLLNNAELFARQLLKPDGTPDFAKQIKMATFLANPDAYDKVLINHGKTLGSASIANTLENASVPDNNQPAVRQQFNSVAEAMAKGGKRS